MFRPALAAGAMFLVLAACKAGNEEPAPAASVASDPFAIRADRNLGDLIDGCPHQNPTHRPRGSNCFGIFPEQCGADQAQAFAGLRIPPEARSAIEAIGPPDGVRFIRPGEPVIQDLRSGRLNIELDADDKVLRIDCY